MKKLFGTGLIVVGTIITLIGLIMLTKVVRSDVPSNATIIGGADGPTTIFLAGELGLPVLGIIIGGITVFVIGFILALIKGDKKNESGIKTG